MELAVAASGGPPCVGCARLSRLDLRTPPPPPPNEQTYRSSWGARPLPSSFFLQQHKAPPPSGAFLQQPFHHWLHLTPRPTM